MLISREIPYGNWGNYYGHHYCTHMFICFHCLSSTVVSRSPIFPKCIKLVSWNSKRLLSLSLLHTGINILSLLHFKIVKQSPTELLKFTSITPSLIWLTFFISVDFDTENWSFLDFAFYLSSAAYKILQNCVAMNFFYLVVQKSGKVLIFKCFLTY